MESGESLEIVEVVHAVVDDKTKALDPDRYVEIAIRRQGTVRWGHQGRYRCLYFDSDLRPPRQAGENRINPAAFYGPSLVTSHRFRWLAERAGRRWMRARLATKGW